MAAIFNAWDSRLQPWSYRPPRIPLVLPWPYSPLGLSMNVLLSGPVAPRPAALAVDMAVVLTLA